MLDFGTSAPIDIQVLGPYFNQEKNYALAQQIQRQVAQVTGVVDSYVYQEPDAPALRLNVDRMRAAQLGLTQQSVAGNLPDGYILAHGGNLASAASTKGTPRREGGLILAPLH